MVERVEVLVRRVVVSGRVGAEAAPFVVALFHFLLLVNLSSEESRVTLVGLAAIPVVSSALPENALQ